METNLKKDSHHRQAEQRAAQWLAQRDGAQWSARDQRALEGWLEESSVHAVAFIRLEAAWTRANRFKALGAGFPSRQVPEPQQLKASPFFDETAPAQSLLQELIHARSDDVKPRALRNKRGWALAACVAMMALAVGVWQLPQSKTTYRTPVGGTASIPMQDGSRVTLNTDSQIRIAVTETERGIQLEHGEAFFEVAKDPRRPFVVTAGEKRIVAVGTAFSVRREGEAVRVLVTEGRVRIEAMEVPAGAVARADGAGVLIEEKSLKEVEEAVSWRSGMVVFRDVSLAAAVAEFNRYNEREIRIEDPGIAAIRLSGKFRPTNVSSFIRLLKDGFPIEVQQRGDAIVLKHR